MSLSPKSVEKELEYHPPKIIEKRTQTACSIDLTEGCNLACEYCFTHSKHKPHTLDLELGKRILNWWLPQTKETNNGECTHIQFWGGEALLEWKLLKELVLYGEELNKDLGRKIEWGGTTNGVLMTPDKVEWGLKHNCLFMFSIDGVKHVHDKYRKFPNGDGSFDIIIKNYKEVKKLFPRVKLRAAISAYSVPYFFESIQFFVEELGQTDILFSPVFEDDWNEEVLSEMELQFDKVIKYAVKRAAEGNPIKLKHIDDEVSIGCKQHEPGNPCGAGITYCAFSVDGFIFPCHRFNKHGLTFEERSSLSTLIGGPVFDYDSNIIGFEWLNDEWRNKFINFKNEHGEKCNNCDLLTTSVCNGGCTALNFDMTGDIHIPPKSECNYNRIQHQAGIEYRRLLEVAGLPINQQGRQGRGCFCNNMCYSEGPGKILKIQKQFLELSKRVLQTMDHEKTEEQRKMEMEVIEKTIKIL